MLRVSIRSNELRVGSRLAISLHRTLRVPDDGRHYPLPPTLGVFELKAVRQYAKKLPAELAKRGGAFTAIYQREALWIFFEGKSWKPNAVQIGTGSVNALTGEPFTKGLSAKPQNYVVAPLQPWLDGFKTADGGVRQFVATALGEGVSVEEQLAPGSNMGGLQFRVYEPKPGRFPSRPPASAHQYAVRELPPMGLAAGGVVEQNIYPDPHGLNAWDTRNRVDVFVHLLHPDDYRRATGEEPPPTPIDAAAYTKCGLPWFQLYEEGGDIGPVEAMRILRPIAKSKEPGFVVPPGQVVPAKKR